MTNTITQRFNDLPWHDSKLLGFSFYREGSQELARVSLQLLEKNRALQSVELIFHESTYVALEVDLEAKSQCSDDISDAECSESSDWIRTLSERNPYDSFEGYLHFSIYLIPPGGSINVLAKDFSLLPPLE